MSTLKAPLLARFGIFLPGVYLAIATITQADPTFWTGPTISFTHDANSSTFDELTTNHVGPDAVNNVWLTRGVRYPLYNLAAESSYNFSTSPVNTLWALNSTSLPLTQATNLTYDTFANVVGHPGDTPSQSVGETFFVYIVSDNIYLQLTLTAWGVSDGGGFSYDRSTPAVVVPPPPTPTVSITNPAPNTVFAAPATLKLGASASVSSGAVTNVQFFANTNTLLGSATATPFNLTSSSLAAGNYTLTAVATAAGVSGTSSVVNVSVVTPVNVSASAAHITSGQFNFSYSVNTGLTYVVQSSSNLLNWVSLATNTPTANPASFSTSLSPKGPAFYRIGRQPNP